MKLSISGKGGAGKTTVAAAIALLLARKGQRVLAVDADPDFNLASSLGIDRELQLGRIVTIATHRKLIEERTGAKVRQYGQMFKLNPEVSDIADTYALCHNGVALLVLGAIERGGTGCACCENVILRALVSELVLRRNENLVMDMEAGIEHLGRATAQGVDTMLVVTEPGQRSIDSTARVLVRAREIGIRDLRLVINKVMTPEDEEFVRTAFPSLPVAGTIPYARELRAADRHGCSVLDGLPESLVETFEEIVATIAANISECDKN